MYRSEEFRNFLVNTKINSKYIEESSSSKMYQKNKINHYLMLKEVIKNSFIEELKFSNNSNGYNLFTLKDFNTTSYSEYIRLSNGKFINGFFHKKDKNIILDSSKRFVYSINESKVISRIYDNTVNLTNLDDDPDYLNDFVF